MELFWQRGLLRRVKKKRNWIPGVGALNSGWFKSFDCLKIITLLSRIKRPVIVFGISQIKSLVPFLGYNQYTKSQDSNQVFFLVIG